MEKQYFTWLTPQLRTWLYGILLAGIPLLIAYGVLDEQIAALWVALGGAVLGLGTAIAHTPRTGKHAKNSPLPSVEGE